MAAFATSYIPTVATQQTRNADAASMTGTNFSSWYNAGEGSFYSETSTVDTASVAHWQIDDTSANNRMVLGQNTSAYHTFTVITGGATQASLSFGSQTLGQFYKIANAYKTNDIAGSRSGAAVLTDTTATLPVVSRLAIGADSSTGAYLNGHIRKIAYYPQRLTNANLQALTA